MIRTRRSATGNAPEVTHGETLLSRLSEREKCLQVVLEAHSQRRVGDLVATESLVGLLKQEHVREDSRAQVFERHT